MKENADKARALDGAELAKQVRDTAEQMFRIRFQMSMGQAEGLKKYRLLRKERARMLTVLGERARGEATAESDLDLFIEMETLASPPERAVEVSSIFGLRPWSMDLVVYTPVEVERLRGVNGTLLALIEAEGKPLYERS